MFEREAEEYALDNYEMCTYTDLPYASDRRAREQAFKDGAKFAFNKVNEWHYPSKGDLPKDDTKVIIIYSWGKNNREFAIALYKRGLFLNPFGNYLSFVNPILVWKELPEPPKEIE